MKKGDYLDCGIALSILFLMVAWLLSTFSTVAAIASCVVSIVSLLGFNHAENMSDNDS